MVAIAKRRIKTLSKLLIDGELEDYQERIATHVEEYYTTLYKENMQLEAKARRC